MLGDVEVDWSTAAWLRRPRDASDRRRDRRPAGVHPAARDATATGCRCSFPPNCPPRRRRVSRTGSRVTASPSCTTSRRCWTGLSPEPTTARNLRWSSVFRISHRIVDAYGRGRVFVAGDAAHIHPPDGCAGHEHRNPGRAQPGVEARARGVRTRGARSARQLRRRTATRRRRGRRPDGAQRP